MFINFWNRNYILILAVFFSFSLGPAFLRAVTVEVEDEDEQAAVEPTPAPVDTHPKIVKVQISPTAGAVPAETSQARVRINEKIGFYYFVKSGFVVHDESSIPAIGRVIGSFEGDMAYSTPKKSYIELSSLKTEVKTGDLLVVYRVSDMIEEPWSGFSGIWARNLAIVKVVEVDKRRCLVETKEAFFPFAEGDKVKGYDDEINRWKQAQVKKPLPDHPVKCFVVGADPNIENYNRADFIILTAGSKKGVVEGQSFDLREFTETGFLDPAIHLRRGTARVFYVGPDCSLAQIISNSQPIQKSFEAIYLP